MDAKAPALYELGFTKPKYELGKTFSARRYDAHETRRVSRVESKSYQAGNLWFPTPALMLGQFRNAVNNHLGAVADTPLNITHT